MATSMVICAMSLAAMAVVWGADSDSSSPDQNTPASSLYDPDAQINSTLQKQQKAQRAEIAAAQEQRQAKYQQQKDDNWLLRNYEEELKTHHTDSSDNLYYQISSDPALSKIAGLTAFDQGSSGQTPPKTNPGKVELTLRNNSPSELTTPTTKNSLLPKPLSSTLSGFTSLHNLYATPSSGMAQFFPKSDNLPSAPSPPTSSRTDPTDPAALDTPGMIAAGNNDPLMDESASDLTLERLPGESTAQARAHQENLSLLEPAATTDIAQLHKQQELATQTPGSKLAPPAPINPVLLKFKAEEADPPVTAPPPSPIRTPVDDPHSFSSFR